MIKEIKKFFNRKRAKRIADFILPLLSNGDKVLDLGCGDLLIAESIQRNLNVKITGIDVVDANLTSLPLKLYNGKKIPFRNKSFDITYAAFMFHHTNNIESLLSECIRVTKKRIIILEDIYENNFDLLMIRVFDYGNKLTSLIIDVPLNFKKEVEWIKLFNKFKVKDVKIRKIHPFPLKLTKHRLFILDLKKK